MFVALWKDCKNFAKPLAFQEKPVPTKRPIFLYSLLATLFVITLLYQAFYLPDFVRGEVKHCPFFFAESGSNRITFASRRVRSLRYP